MVTLWVKYLDIQSYSDELLSGRMGFQNFVCSDINGVGGGNNCTSSGRFSGSLEGKYRITFHFLYPPREDVHILFPTVLGEDDVVTLLLPHMDH